MDAIRQHYKVGNAIDDIIAKKDRKYVCQTAIMDNRANGADADEDEKYFDEIDKLDKDIERLKANYITEVSDLNQIVKDL